MNESLKASLGGVMFFGALACITWLVDPPPGETWQLTVRWVGLAMLLAPIPILVWAQLRKDKAPDFLARITTNYFERDGFCFTILPEVTNGTCRLVIYFQNRYEKPCQAMVVLRGSQFLLRSQAQVSQATVGISCEAAGVGKSSILWAIPQEAQGKEITLDVAASVNYPDGRGKLIRFRDGMRVGAVGAEFWREGLQVMGAIGGTLVITTPARLKLRLPTGVLAQSDIPPDCKTENIWKSGDPIVRN